MAASMASMEMSDIPRAVFSARLRAICRLRMTVSRAMDVRRPFTMANAMMAKGSQGHPPSWKAAIVPISPMEQPSKHQLVLTEARRQLCLQRQLRVRGEVAAVLMTAVSLHSLS